MSHFVRYAIVALALVSVTACKDGSSGSDGDAGVDGGVITDDGGGSGRLDSGSNADAAHAADGGEGGNDKDSSVDPEQDSAVGDPDSAVDGGDACEGVTCGANSTCDDGSGLPVCVCDSGFQDANGDSVCMPSCDGIDCSGNGSCSVSAVTGLASCTCMLGFEGAACGTANCAATTCENGGVCDVISNVATCTCDVGWEGPSCEEANCDATTCDNGGQCEIANNEPMCDCATGWEGSDCSTANCDGTACVNGSCSVVNNAPVCDCVTGWQGADCATANCDATTCNNGGTCGVVNNVAVCDCVTGWGGANCGTANCDATTCDNGGSCSIVNNAPVCACTTGWEGASCATANCAATTCNNGGTCSVVNNSPVCACAAGWEGASCSTANCAATTCNNGGSCSVSNNIPACTCATGWEGASCDTANCDTTTCNHFGTCSMVNNAATCGCVGQWTGASCSTPTCVGETCGGRGTCATDSGQALCTCDAGYGGVHCDMQQVYGLNIPASTVWRAPADVIYAPNNAAAFPSLFDRVAYRMQIDDQHVVVEANTFTQEPSRLGVPVDWIFNQGLTGIDVRSSVASIPEVQGLGSGRLEFWSHCYNPGLNGIFDYDDDITPTSPDCYGSMQISRGTTTLFAVNRWASGGPFDIGIGNGPDGNDWTFSGNAQSVTTRRLDVFARPAPSCASVPANVCGAHGTCSDLPGGGAVCACAPSYQGRLCDECAPGTNDYAGDGNCSPACGGGTCDGLHDVRSLSTGVHDLVLLSGSTPVYIDGTYDGGGWVLIGRGREGWQWSNAGAGLVSDIPFDLGTPAAFTPNYMNAALVQGLLEASGGADVAELEVRIKRAASPDGTSYQEVLWDFATQASWDWDFDAIDATVRHTVQTSVLGPKVELTGNTRDISSTNSYERIFTWGWDGHDFSEGFAYGNAITAGSNDATSFWWLNGSENHPIPYTEVYIRLPSCKPDTCAAGTCDDSGVLPLCICGPNQSGDRCELCDAGFQDNDQNGTCTASCTATTCNGSPGTTCVDLGGPAMCLLPEGASCLEILDADAFALSGGHVIDVDGAGGADPLPVYCDMDTDGGGWTRISREDFESGAAPGWSVDTVDSSSTCATLYSSMLGGYDILGTGVGTTKDYDLLDVAHTEARVTLDYLVLDSWDGEFGRVYVGGNLIFEQLFFMADGTGNCGVGNYPDIGPVKAAGIVTHSAALLNVQVTSSLDQDPSDESFGADNIVIWVR